jgi:hypothetical protein
MMVWQDITSWFKGYELLLGWLGAVSLLMFFGTLIVVPMIIVRLPKNFLLQEKSLAQNWPRYLSIPFYVLKNALGVLLVFTGLAMLVLPGQGILTLFVGLILINFPQKRILIRRIVGQKRIFRGINRLRTRFGKPRFELP